MEIIKKNVIHKESLYPRSRDINRLMMVMMTLLCDKLSYLNYNYVCYKSTKGLTVQLRDCFRRRWAYYLSRL
jgi:hypothetical protein